MKPKLLPEPVTIRALASFRLGYPADNASDFVEAELPMIGACEECAKSIGAHNAYPAHSGNIRCRACLQDTGWLQLDEAAADIFGEAP